MARLLAPLALVASVAQAAVHPEIVVGVDYRSNLVARFDTPTFPLPASRFPGIEGYADAMPGFSSLAEAQPSDDFFPPDGRANIVFTFDGADRGAAIWNDHGSALMKPGESFTLGQPFFDSHPIWNIVKGKSGKRYVYRLRMRDLSGRHRDSAPFTPAFSPTDGNEAYACPMACQEGTLYQTPARCPVCGMTLKLQSARSYQVRVTPDKIPSGRETKFRFEILSPDGERVNDLEVVHEKLLHLLLVSNDLSWFAHEHPRMNIR